MKRSIFMQFQKLHRWMSERELMKIEGESTKLEAESIGGLDFVTLDLSRGGYTGKKHLVFV